MNLNNVQQELKWNLTCLENQFQGRDKKDFYWLNHLPDNAAPQAFAIPCSARVQSFQRLLCQNYLGMFVERADSQIVWKPTAFESFAC